MPHHSTEFERHINRGSDYREALVTFSSPSTVTTTIIIISITYPSIHPSTEATTSVTVDVPSFPPLQQFKSEIISSSVTLLQRSPSSPWKESFKRNWTSPNNNLFSFCLTNQLAEEQQHENFLETTSAEQKSPEKISLKSAASEKPESLLLVVFLKGNQLPESAKSPRKRRGGVRSDNIDRNERKEEGNGKIIHGLSSQEFPNNLRFAI